MYREVHKNSSTTNDNEDAPDIESCKRSIKELIALKTNTTACASEVKALTVSKIAIIEEKMTVLEEIKATLTGLVQQCDGKGGVSDCTILKALENN